MQPHFSAAAVLFVSLATAVPVQAQDIRLVTGPDYHPFTDDDLPGGGLATELVRQAFDRAGATVTVDFTSWVRGYASVRDGSYVATFPYILTEEREAEMLASDPMYTVQFKMVSSVDRMLEYEGAAALAGLIMCLPVGFGTQGEIQAQIDTGAVAVEQPESYGACFRQVLADRADFMVVNETIFRATLADEGMDVAEFHFAQAPVQSLTHHLLVSRDNPDGPAVLERFNEGLAALKADGAVDGLFAVYTGAPQTN